MDILCKFGPVKVLFQDFPTSPEWPFWQWKLDPYKIEKSDPDIIINREILPITPDLSPIWEDNQALITRQFYILPNGKILWQQTENASGKRQLQLILSEDLKKITLTEDCSDTFGMGAFEALTFIIFYAFIHKNILTFHGVLIEHEGKGILLCADSGMGKTTHARLWRDHKNALIINGDRPSFFEKNGEWYGFGTPWCGTSGEYLNRKVPLKAIVVLEKGPDNIVTVENAMSLFHHLSYPAWHSETAEKTFSLLDGLLGKIPVLRLQCTRDKSAVDTLNQALESLPI